MENLCSQADVTCKDCGEVYKRELESFHFDVVCGERFVICPVEPLGCKFKVVTRKTFFFLTHFYLFYQREKEKTLKFI